jgi:thiol-disulfide isomerase/thioredoxin
MSFKNLIKIFANNLLTLLLIFTLSACKNKPSELKEGSWRATLKTKSGVEIPFNFIVQDSAGKKIIYILNGEEEFKVDEIVIKEDSIFIQMPLFDSEIKANLSNNLTGNWIKHLADKDIAMHFNAEHNISWRFFETDGKTKNKIEGRWTTTFVSEDGKDTTLAVGEFKQSGVKLSGTFLTTSGDYRYLQGNVSDGKLFLSTFDGSHAYLFTADIENDNTILNGKFYAGYSSIENWTATRDEKAMLPDAYSLTGLKSGYNKIDFAFPNLNKKQIALSDEKFKNKVLIVQFLGSWCPNCMDETAFLSPFYKDYKTKGLEVVGLAYERTKDFERSRKNLQRFKDRFNVDYDILITGYTNNNEDVLKSIPSLNNFQAFPTTIIIDKKGVVRKIHTGFNGPGTGEHYTTFKSEFETLINNLLAEK